jgi:hypothetical protein|tara:strand:+ start:262 stop:543 length:282 start_codon:yes stop_codon:yes gene_type:complete
VCAAGKTRRMTPTTATRVWKRTNTTTNVKKEEFTDEYDGGSGNYIVIRKHPNAKKAAANNWSSEDLTTTVHAKSISKAHPDFSIDILAVDDEE